MNLYGIEICSIGVSDIRVLILSCENIENK